MVHVMARRPLTASHVAALKAVGTHWVDASLYLQIKPQGARSWLFRYERDGRTSWMGLGPASRVSFSKARELATKERSRVFDGLDPLAEKKAKRAEQKAARSAAGTSGTVAGDAGVSMSLGAAPAPDAVRKGGSAAAVPMAPSFARCARDYIAAHEAGWSNPKHIAQWSSTITTYANPILGQKPVDTITVQDVLRVLEPIWTEKPETASRLRGRIERIMGWAAAKGYRTGENPARWQGGHLIHLLPPLGRIQTVTPRKAVPWRHVPLVAARLERLDTTGAKALLFTILTAARTTETLGARWQEIDVVDRLWIVPAERMKMKREHRVALSDQAVALLDTLPRTGGFIFPGQKRNRPLSNLTMLKCLRDIRGDTGDTVHGFRSSFSTWAAEATSHPREIVEAALAHATGDAVELAYKRTDYLDKRRALMADWAEFVVGKASR